MEEYFTRKGTRVRHAEGATVHDDSESTVAGTSRRRSGALPQFDAATTALLNGITSGPDVSVHDAFSVVPALATRRRGEAVEATEVEVDVGEDERAVLLLEKEGIFEWRLPEEREARVRRRSGEAAGRRTLLFRLGGGATPEEPGGARRRGLIDYVAGEIGERVRAYVVKFLARAAVAGATRVLERDVAPGLIAITDDNPDTWKATQETGRVSITGGSAPRLLFFIHGTFSSTRGGFGALGLTPEGKAFLNEARKRYDAILAFDHATLSEAPDENAKAIFTALKALSLPPGTKMDIVAHSRGGLVARYLCERLLGDEQVVTPERIIFVGSTNGGTALADRSNWKALLDLYTNLAVAAGRGLMIFDAGTASSIITESVKTLGSFVQAVVDAGITDEMTPGLAAMSPSSSFVGSLNAALSGPDTGKARYFAIGSEFETKLFDRNDREQSLPRKLMQALADFGVDSLMRESNDLVVDTEAMSQFGGKSGRLAASLFWDGNAVIYHTNYFAQPGVVEALRAWLLEDRGDARPPGVAMDPLALSTTLSVREARARLETSPKNQIVVLDRPSYGFYVRTAGYIRSRIADASEDMELASALDLHETQVADRVEGSSAAPARIGVNGWVRIVNGVASEAAPPPLIENFELARNRRAVESTQDDRLVSASIPRRRGGSEDLGDLDVLLELGDRTSAEPSRELPARSEDTLDEVKCHFGAEMPESCPLSTPADLTITVSREDLQRVVGPTSAISDAMVRLSQAIKLEVQAKANCEVVGDATAQVRVPELGKPEHYDFKIKGLHAGPAEIWVDARQGARRLARMVLQPVFIETGKLTASALADTTKVDPPLVELRIYESSEGPNSPFSLRFVMESEDLNILLDEETPRFKVAREPYIASLYKSLEGEWGANGQDFQRYMRGLRAFGANLYNQLVPEAIREKIWEHRNEIGAIQVISHEPFIPWEALHVVEPGKATPPNGNMFLAELGLVRWVKNIGWPPASLKIGQGRARHVVPTYEVANLALPGAERERKLLNDLFGSIEVAAESEKVIELISTPGSFDLLHFACHGNATEDRIWDASLLLGARAGGGGQIRDALSTVHVSEYGNLRSSTKGGPIIFLNACQAGKTGSTLTGTGGMAEAFTRAGAGLFVGSLWSIGDATAITFAKAFYEHLKGGDTITRAAREARQAAKAANEPTWLAYTVYGHPYARLSFQ